MISNWREVLMALIGTVCLGLIDVAVAMGSAGISILCNGVFCLPSTIVYHGALYLAVGCLWGLLLFRRKQ